MGAILSVNLLANSIDTDQAEALVSMLKDHPTLKSLCGNRGDETELDMSGKFPNFQMGASGAIMLAAEINRTEMLTSLNLSSNCLTGDNGDDMSGNMLNPPVHDMIRYTKPITCYPFTGVAALANAIPDMRAILSLNLLQNDISIDQAKALTSILKEHPTLKSLCGNAGDETELDISGNEMGEDGAIMLAAEIADNGTLTKLTFGNKQVVTMTTEMTEANFSGKLKSYEAQIVAAFLPKCK
jgi:hypothetical protein